jgi:hypothetical protein
MELGAADSVGRLGPELALAVTLVVVALAGRSGRGAEIGILGAAASFVFAAELFGWGEVWVLERMLVVDGLALFGKACVALALVGSLAGEARGGAEASRLARFLVAGIALDVLGSAGNVVATYLALEVAASAIASLGSAAGTAGAAARMASSSTIAGALAWTWRFAGSCDYEEIRKSVVETAPFGDVPVAIAAWLLLAGITVRVGVVAFRVRSDCSGGLLFAVGLATEAFIVMVRILFGALGTPGVEETGAAPVVVGGPAALRATALAVIVAAAIALARSRSLVALLVASSGATIAYALVEAATGTLEGIHAALVLAGASVVPTTGAFQVVSVAPGGMARVALVAAFLAALAAAPFLAEPPGGRGIFTAALRTGGELGAAAVFSCVVIQLGCYARALRAVVAAPAEPRPAQLGLADVATLALFGFLTIAIALDPGALVRIATRSAVWLPT